MYGRYYYPNLEVMLHASNKTKMDISNALGLSYRCVEMKLNGKSSLKLDEAFAIRKVVGAEKMDLEELFLHT